MVERDRREEADLVGKPDVIGDKDLLPGAEEEEDRTPKGRHAKCRRWFQLVAYLELVGGCTYAMLHEHFGKHVKTLLRDLQGLQEIGIPLVDEMVNGEKVWRLAFDDVRVKYAALVDLSQWLVLRIAMEQNPALRGSSFLFAAAEAVSQLMETALGKEIFKELRALDRCIVSHDKQAMLRAPPDVIYPLLTATSQNKICKITYESPEGQGISSYEILPLYLLSSHTNGLLYVRYWHPEYKTISTILLNRLISLIPTNREGERPSDEVIQEFEDRAFNIYAGKELVTITLRYTAKARKRVEEKKWHRTQVLTPLPDGGVELTFTCGESPELFAWVASWTDQVFVVGPLTLQQSVAQKARNVVKMYEEVGL